MGCSTHVQKRSLEGLMLKLKLQYFGHLMRRVDSLGPQCWEGLGAGGEGDDRGWDGWMASLTQWAMVWVNSGSWWWTGRPGVLWFMGSQRVGHDWATELNWTDRNCTIFINQRHLQSFPLQAVAAIHLVPLCILRTTNTRSEFKVYSYLPRQRWRTDDSVISCIYKSVKETKVTHSFPWESEAESPYSALFVPDL